MATKAELESAARLGREAVGKTYRDCPFGQGQRELRETWCKTRLVADEESKPWLRRLLFGSGPISSIIGWIIFLGACAAAYKVYELIFGCIDEFGRKYC